MKCWGHMFKHHSRYPVGSRRFVIWCAAEGFLEDSKGDMSDQHWTRRGGAWSDMAEPGKGSAHGECGVRREGLRLQLGEMCYHLLRGGEKLTRALIAEDGKVGGECSCVYLSFRGSEYGRKS